MTEPTWWSYVKRTAGTDVGQPLAQAAEVSESQISRWRSGQNQPDIGAIVRFARFYRRPPVEAIIAAGYLSADEAGAPIQVVRPLTDLSDDDLVAEVARRMKGAHRDQSRTDPSAAPEGAEDQAGEGEKTDSPAVADAKRRATASVRRQRQILTARSKNRGQ